MFNLFFIVASTKSNASESLNLRNEYRLPKATGNSHFYSTIQLNHQRQFSSLPPSSSNASNTGQDSLINQINQEPPPPYRKRATASSAIIKFIPPPPPLLHQHYHNHQRQSQQRPAPTRLQVRSRVEEYRNRNLSDSELSDSERHQQRQRNRSVSQRSPQGRIILRSDNQRRSNEILLGRVLNFLI